MESDKFQPVVNTSSYDQLPSKMNHLPDIEKVPDIEKAKSPADYRTSVMPKIQKSGRATLATTSLAFQIFTYIYM